ncbi:hypothetical protein M3Y94_00832600 [Aphelenchoides besseyi]|nr:hypothetical protein M3Y94_00832600 [Aphelenchoides besseyi]KAI6227003.1 hypothetical protein M3Y95_00681000 [Aphelenchoides besseyi]
MEDIVQETTVYDQTKINDEVIEHKHVELSKNRNELGDLVITVDVTTEKLTLDSGYNENPELGFQHEEEQLNGVSTINHELVVEEDDVRSRHSSGTSVEQPQPIERAPELKQRGFALPEKLHDEKIERTELNEQRENVPVRKLQPLQRDFTQQSVDRKPERDENDWAKKHLGSGRINDLIARFNQGTVLNDKSDNSPQYKSDYGVGKGKGHIEQNVFH